MMLRPNTEALGLAPRSVTFQFGGGVRSGRFILDGIIIGSWKSPGSPVW